MTDGIFTNYTWSKDAPAKSHALAKGRNFDVYTGTDVWGRNTYGGGGFNVHKAFRVVHDAETSVAIFAPAWTYEFLGTDSFEKVNDPRFWVECSSKPILPSITGTPPNLPSTFPDPADLGCVADFVEPRRLSGNCFRTNFCLGFGSSYWIQGKKVSSASWSHIGRQSLLSSSWLTKAPKSSVVLEYTTDLAFHGGSCLQLSLDLPKGAIDEGIQLVPIFDCEMCIVEDSFFQGSMQTTSFDKRIGCFVQTDDDVQCKWFKKGDMERNDWWTFSMEIKRGVTVRALGICISADPENEPFNDAEMVESSNCPVLSCFAIPQSNSRTNGIQSKMGDKIDSNVKEANVIKSVDISLPDPALPKSEHPKQRVYIGQMSLQPKRPEMSAPLEVLSHHITIRDVFREDGMAYWTLSWPSEPGFECWEVYRGDSVWIGTALTNAFRDSGPDVPQNGTSYHIYGYEY